MISQALAEAIIESLRMGKPPNRGIREYSAGNDGFLDQIRLRHLRPEPGLRGKIRFVSGSWGSGKSHFLAQIREMAFESNYLVSSVALSADETPFNRFEEVFYRIVKQISSPEMYASGAPALDAPLGEVFRRQLFANQPARSDPVVSAEIYDTACQELMANAEIDIDFRRLVCRYWETFLPESGDVAFLQDCRGRIMQWFSGEGTIGLYRKEFGVQKLVSRSNARTLLRSLSSYAIHAGFTGIVVLLDEAEMSYSVMRKSAVKTAQNNLLHLINSIEESPGLFLVYATTPDFYSDPHHGIQAYGALAQRIGRPEEHPPRALDRVWNLEHAQPDLADYQAAARKIRKLYITAFPEFEQAISNDRSLDKFVKELLDAHPRFSAVGFWRVLVKGVIDLLEHQAEGRKVPSAADLHDRIIDELKE
jgi:P-loop Domain of unknown function (DUF2791)